MQRFFTTNEKGKNLTDTLLDKQNLEMEIRFVFIVGTQEHLLI